MNEVKPKSKYQNKMRVAIATVAILIVAAGIYFASRITNEGEAPQEHNKYDTQFIEDEQSSNLLKLSKVWGFAKYTHQVFLLGEKCWDEELLALIPIVQHADKDDVNDILYNWFIGLGDDGYDLDYSTVRLILLADFPSHYEIISNFFEDTNNHNWASIERLHRELWLLNTGREINLRPMADLKWINGDYLGASLAMALSRFHKVQVIDREMSPVYFDHINNSVFTNKERFVDIDYANSNYRLLGLFRIWNTVKYFFPYLDIIDYDWSELLLEYIPKMLEGMDQISYEETLVTLASKLQDAHIRFVRGSAAWEPRQLIMSIPLSMEIITRQFGSYIAPVGLREAEGHLVVDSSIHSQALKRGDVILRVNGADIGEITTAMLQYLPYPNECKALSYLVRDNIVLRQHSGNTPMAIDVYRFGDEVSVYVDTMNMSVVESFNYIWRYNNTVLASHMILENNIGLINPFLIPFEAAMPLNLVLHDVMMEFEKANVSGLIIDMRQGSPGRINFLLAEYLFAEQRHFITFSGPFGFMPGMFIDIFHYYAGYGIITNQMRSFIDAGFMADTGERFGSFFHNHSVVVLANEHTQSSLEFTVMTLRDRANVTVMGTNTIGANGDMVFFPLPGGLVMSFSGLGIYMPDGGQTQRIGLTPDIYMPRTIAGISEGRDELMEAAIQFLR